MLSTFMFIQAQLQTDLELTHFYMLLNCHNEAVSGYDEDAVSICNMLRSLQSLQAAQRLIIILLASQQALLQSLTVQSAVQ